jgi:hypothetical protein
MSARRNETYDIFVSYSAKDDELPKPFHAWVTQFCSDLASTLAASGGREYTIYFAPRTAESNQHWNEIEKHARKSRIFLAIVSPSYLSRDWPRRELAAFLEPKPDSRRLFVVAAEPVGPDAHPALSERT